MTLHEALKQLKEHGPGDRYQGICGNLWHYYEASKHKEESMYDLFMSWTEYSGETVFPLPGGQCAYFDTKNRNNGWNPDHPYGALRLSLLDHMIENTKP